MAVALSVAWIACGAGAPPRDSQGSTERAERAAAALTAGDLRRAGREADAALELDPEGAPAREIGARVALAEGRTERAIALLGEATRPELVRLRARARVALGDLAGAATDLGSVDGRPPEDGWAVVMLEIARGARDRQPCTVEGAAGARLPLVGEGPLPVVSAVVDGREVNALVATSADLAVVDERLRARPGVLDRIDLGEVVVRDVPAIPRDLSDVSQAVGAEVGLVIGLAVLAGVGATIDFRARELLLAPGAEVALSAGAAALPYATFGGSFLAVPATLDGHVHAWLSLDTAAGFPLALDDEAVRALGHDPATLPEAPGAPSPSVRVLEVQRIALGSVAIDGVPAATGLVPPELSELSGTRIAGIAGAPLLASFRVTIDPRGRRIVIE